MKVSIVTPSFNQLTFLKQTAASVLGQFPRGGQDAAELSTAAEMVAHAAPHPNPLPEGEGTRNASASPGDTRTTSGTLPLPPGEGRGEGHRGPASQVDLEWLILDGGSTDGTVDYLKALTDPRIHWTSEKDAGQSDAINKGLKRATGDIIGWLNSDDLYTPGALETVAAVFEKSPETRWAVGRYQIINGSNAVIRPGIVRYKEKQLRHYTYRTLLRENFIPQPAVFWRRDFGQSVGLLDTTLHFTMDYDYWLRMGWHHDPLFIDRVLAQFRVHESSKTGVINRQQFDEGYQVAKRYAGDDRAILRAHWRSVEKIVWAYRLMRLIGR